MRLAFFALAVLLVCGVAHAQYTGPWTQTWDFSDGTQGWVKTQGSGYWVDPAVSPSGPTIPDGAPSGGGAGNLYCPDGTRYEMSITPSNQWVLQVDAYLPNMVSLNINTVVPGNGIQNAGIGAISNIEYKHVYVTGRNPDGVKIRDHAWDNTDRTRSWLFEEVGVAKADMWDDWVTLQLVYNVGNSGKFTGYVYTPWDSGVHDGPGWYAFAQYDVHPDAAKRFYQNIMIGSVLPSTNSWTQAQFDNVKFAALPEPGTWLALATGLVGLGGMIRRRK